MTVTIFLVNKSSYDAKISQVIFRLGIKFFSVAFPSQLYLAFKKGFTLLLQNKNVGQRNMTTAPGKAFKKRYILLLLVNTPHFAKGGRLVNYHFGRRRGVGTGM